MIILTRKAELTIESLVRKNGLLVDGSDPRDMARSTQGLRSIDSCVCEIYSIVRVTWAGQSKYTKRSILAFCILLIVLSCKVSQIEHRKK